jgi:Xaa-Pro aminopeptidase
MLLTENGCLERQRRLREQLDRLNIDAVVLTDYRDVYYFTGVLLADKFPGVRTPVFMLLETRGRCWLAADSCAPNACVAECLEYEWGLFSTINPDPLRRLEQVVATRLKGAPRVKRLGFQAESLPHQLANTAAETLYPDEWVAIDDLLSDMQSRKDPDEVDVIRRCVQINLAAYTAAKAVIAPGVNELDVLAAGQRAAMLAVGQPVYHGGDYRSGELGGPARNRAVERGEIYIIDAQTYYGGYWSDLSRAFSVGGEPTALQQSIFDHIAAVQAQVPALLKPGVDGRDVWRELDKLVRQHPAFAETGLIHHGGHAVGLRVHEMPDLNRERGGLLEVGNVLSVEPAGYTDEARYGVRIENMYLITESGVENLSEYPVSLV